MSARQCLVALLLGLVAGPAAAQDTPGLIAKNLAARGGAAALLAIKSIRFEGRTIYPGDFELTYHETRARVGQGAATRIDLTIQGLDVVQAYDGHGNGWKINPFQGRKDAEKISADAARALADEALIEGPLLASRTDGSRVDYLGRDDFDGTLAYKLKVTQKDGDEFTYWLDPDTFLEIKIEESRMIRGTRQISETELGDYEKIAGVYYPMSIESWPQGADNSRQRTIIASGEANPAVGADYFAEPGGTSSAATTSGGPPSASAAPPTKATASPKRAVSRKKTGSAPPSSRGSK